MDKYTYIYTNSNKMISIILFITIRCNLNVKDDYMQQKSCKNCVNRV